LDVEKIKAIIEAMDRTEITRFEYESEDERLVLRKEAGKVVTQVLTQAAEVPAAVIAAAPAAPSKEQAAAAPVSGTVIPSPFVGTFYRAPSPDSPNFVELGDTVQKGQTLCIVEAMKLMNEIESEVSGKVVEIYVENAQPVEFGEPLFRIE
jgi:acetyl-CoA carboxylase biotin carboxyl carrier protein